MRKTPPHDVAAGLVTLQRLPLREALQRAQEMFPEYHFTTMTTPDGRTSPVMVPDAPTHSYEIVPAAHRAGCPDLRAPVRLEVSARAAVMHYDSGEPSAMWKSIAACLQYHGVGYQDLRQNGAPLAFTPPEWLTSGGVSARVSAPLGGLRRSPPRLRPETLLSPWQSGGQRFDPAWLHHPKAS